MGLKTSRLRFSPNIQDKKHLTPAELQMVADSSDKPFIQIQTFDPPDDPQPLTVFLDTSLQQVLYGQPIGEDSPSSNLSTVWIITNAIAGSPPAGSGPWIISNATTPIGQAQPSPELTGTNTRDINVLPAPTGPDSEGFVWNSEFRDGKWALYYELPGAPRLYALPVKSDDPNLSPPRDNLIKAVQVDPNTQNVYVFNFSWADDIKYNPSMPSGIDVYLRPQSQ